jgi:integrase/recombinase XerC
MSVSLLPAPANGKAAPSRLPQLTAQAQKAVDVTPAEMLQRWLGRLSQAAVRKYSLALRLFVAWAVDDDSAGPDDAMRILVDAGPARAHALVEAWRDDLLAQGKATATAAAYIGAVGSLVRACRRSGLLSWSLEGVAPKAEKRQDRRGPPRHEVERLLASLDDKAAAGDRSAARDACIVRLLHNAALRRGEVVGLVFPRDVDLEGGDGPAVAPRRKGHRERTRMLVGEKAAESLRAWLAVRGLEPGPLFVGMRGKVGAALTGEGVRIMLRKRARQAGCRAVCRPHGMRHASATEVARRGSLDELQALGGWRTLTAASHYVDQRQRTRARAIGLVEA